MDWLAGIVQSGGRARATANLEDQAHVAYSPRYFCHLTRKVTDLFPGYILIKPVGTRTQSIEFTRGLSGLVKMDGRPCGVSQVEIDKFKASEGADGLVRLPRKQDKRRFQPGDRATLIRGQLSGWHGSQVLYEESLPEERCAILMHLLGRAIRIVVQEGDLVAVAA